VGRQVPHLQVAMAMYEDNARQLNGVLSAINPTALENVVPLGHIDSMLKLRDRLDAGDFVGVLADRTLGNEPVVKVPFLGAPAAFPTGPMRMAAAMRQKVFLMVGLFRGGNRYEVRFEELADFSEIGDRPGTDPGRTPVSGSRQQLVHEAIARYVARIEHYTRSAPYNWFNFFDFWGPR
jgi:predicted LPLAT superfamily acyltransferase